MGDPLPFSVVLFHDFALFLFSLLCLVRLCFLCLSYCAFFFCFVLLLLFALSNESNLIKGTAMQ